MKYKVMLADDEPIMRKALQTLIDWSTIECEVVNVAENGWQVISYLEENDIDILITDIKMPGLDGIDIAKYIWEKKLPTKVILLTAYADFSYAQSAIKYNVVEYVTKTGNFEELLLAINRCKTFFSENTQLYSSERELRIENFFRGIYEGTICDHITERYRQLGLEESCYIKVVFKFLIDDIKDKDQRAKVYNSLQNFFHLTFFDQMIYGMFYRKDVYGLLLKCSGKVENDLENINP